MRSIVDLTLGLICLVALVSLGCGGSADVVPPATVAQSRASSTPQTKVTVADPTDTPHPTTQPIPTQIPSPTPTVLVSEPVLRAVANSDANLRSGPSTEFDRVGAVTAGQELDLVATNQAGDWYRLASDAWIAAFLVDNAPDDLPIDQEAPTVTPVKAAPAVPLDTPTSTPEPPAAQPIGGQIRISGMLRDGLVAQTETDEYVEITNVGDAPVDLTGWRLESERRGQDDGQIFYFPQGFVMQPNQGCRIYTNENHPEWCGLSFGHGRGAVWANNDPDAALLIDADGNIVQRFQ